MSGTKLLHADLTYAIRGVLFDVGTHLGSKFPEADFQQAVSIGLTKRGIAHSLEEQFEVYYHDARVGRYYCDLIVEDKVVVELKVADELNNLHRAQLLSYLRVTGMDVGLLANFGPKVKIERYAYFYARRRPDFQWQVHPPQDTDLLYPVLVGRLYECLHRVHYELGPGFWHNVYRKAVQAEFREQGITCWYVHEIPVYYEEQHISTRQCRLIFVDDKILLAAFAVRQVTDDFKTRMRRYLKYFDKELGLLANFYGERLDIRPVRIGKNTTNKRNTQ